MTEAERKTQDARFIPVLPTRTAGRSVECTCPDHDTRLGNCPRHGRADQQGGDACEPGNPKQPESTRVTGGGPEVAAPASETSTPQPAPVLSGEAGDWPEKVWLHDLEPHPIEPDARVTLREDWLTDDREYEPYVRAASLSQPVLSEREEQLEAALRERVAALQAKADEALKVRDRLKPHLHKDRMRAEDVARAYRWSAESIEAALSEQPEDCERCFGKGRIYECPDDGPSYSGTCPDCNGTGKKPDQPEQPEGERE